MASIGSQSFTRLVSVRKNKTGEAVSLRSALADASVGEKVVSNFHFITPQLEAMRAFTTSALSGGSVVLAGAGGTGKSSIMYVLSRALSVAYPSDEFSSLSDLLGDVSLVRSLAGLRTAGRRWLVAVPDFSNGRFAFSMRGALNGALLGSEQTSDFVPKDGTLSEEFSESTDFLRHQGSFDGLLVLGDNFENILTDCVAHPEADNAKDLREFTAFCASSPFPILFVSAIERDLSFLSLDEEELLLQVFQKVLSLTLLGKAGEWENLVAKSILCHPDPEVWDDAVDYKDFHTIVEESVHQGLYAGYNDKWLNDIVVCGAYPLHPAALFALPRVAMNLSSSTKTAFRFFSDGGPGGLAYFLNNYAVLQPNSRLHLYTADWLCTYFEKVIQKDPHNKFYTSALQNAVLAAGDVPQSRRILRLIMIMQLIGNDRFRPQMETILWALHLGEREERVVRNSLQLLLQKHALEYSEKTKEYLLPVPKHEIDVPQAVQRNRNRMRSQLDLRQELQSGLPTLRVKALGYNKKYYTDRCGAMRAYISSDVQEPSHFFDTVNEIVNNTRPYRGDLLFAFVIPDSESDMQTIIERIKDGKYNHQRLVMVIPKRVHQFAKDILEVRTLEHMLNLEPPFSDATTAEHAQIERMLDSVTQRLDSYSESLLNHENLMYFYNGEQMEFTSDEHVQQWLDAQMPELAGVPPLIASYDLMAWENSGKARRNCNRLISYLLATGDSIAFRNDARDIKLMVDEGLVRTQILRETACRGFWTHYELNAIVPDEGLGKAYNAITKAILDTAVTGKAVSVASLLRPWLRHPYAMTPALMEILLAIILWYWPREIKLFKNNERAQAESRPELLQPVEHSAEAIETMVADSSDWVISFCEADRYQKLYLEGICRVVGEPIEHEGSLWVHAAKSLIGWYKSCQPADREPALIKTQELQKFNRFLMNAPKRTIRLREYIEFKLPSLLGEPSVFSWVADAEDMVKRLDVLCQKFAGQINSRRERLEQALKEVFVVEGHEDWTWQEGAKHWFYEQSELGEENVCQVEINALAKLFDLPATAQLDSLIESLGYAPMNVWKYDCVDDIVERMSAMRSTIHWKYYSRGFHQTDVEQAARMLGVDVLRASGLSEEGIQELLETYLEALTWPEAVRDELVDIAQDVTVATKNVSLLVDYGDWLVNDDINILATLEGLEDDTSAVVTLGDEEWLLNNGDFLAAEEDNDEDDDEVVVVQPAAKRSLRDITSGINLSTLVAKFGNSRSGETEAVAAPDASKTSVASSAEPVIPAVHAEPVIPAVHAEPVIPAVQNVADPVFSTSASINETATAEFSKSVSADIGENALDVSGESAIVADDEFADSTSDEVAIAASGDHIAKTASEEDDTPHSIDDVDLLEEDGDFSSLSFMTEYIKAEVESKSALREVIPESEVAKNVLDEEDMDDLTLEWL